MTAFLLTWKEGGWPHKEILRMRRAIENKGFVDEPWRIHAYRNAQAGDRVWLLKQGKGPKGIFGAGNITGKPRLGPTSDGRTRMMAPVRFRAFVDPKQHLLIGEGAARSVLTSNQFRAQASGDPISDEQSDALEKLLETALLTNPRAITMVASKDSTWTSGALAYVAARPSVEEYRKAFADLPPLSAKLERALRSHIRAPRHLLSVGEICRKAGWKDNGKNHGPVGIFYGGLGHKVADKTGIADREITYPDRTRWLVLP